MRNLALPSTLSLTLAPEVIRLLQNIVNDRRINIGVAQPLIIDTGAVTITTNYSSFTIDGIAASTDLNTISNAIDGDLIFCRSVDDGRNIVFKHGADNLLCNGAADLTLDTTWDLMMCLYDGDLERWKCIKWTTG